MAEELNIAENNEEKHQQEVEENPQEIITEATAPEETLPEETFPEEHKKEKTNHLPKANLEDFNWDEIGQEKKIYSEEEYKELEDIYSQSFKSIIEQEVVDGTVVAITPREVVVNIGYKSDGIIPSNELRHNPNLKIGDTIEVYVEKQEDSEGQLVLSHKKARLLKAWNRVNKAYDDGEIVNGYIKSKTKGGLIVDVFGIEAFLPGSQIDVKPIRDYDVFVDKTMEFKIVKINQEFKNVVVSHKALIELELDAQRAKIIAGLEKGQILEGVVKNITNYGAFIDLNGVDGLIHITDLAWGRINHPEEIIQLDEKLNVVILDFDEEKKRIALGLKQLTPHPWDSLDANLKEGDKVSGKVVVVADYGAFIEIHPGVEGLLHVSEMSWSQHLRTAHDFLSVGDTVEAVILTLNREERKMSLGIKQLIPDPWTNISEKYLIGSKHTAIVRNFTTFGIFVELEEGIDGLIHISDLSWSKKIKHPAEFTKIGEQIEVVILEMDIENRRLSLGHKQLEENSWEIFETIYNVNSIHEGTVIGQNDKGVIVSLQGVEGFVFNRNLTREDNTVIKMGETADFKVVEFSKENKKIVLSHSRIWQDVLDAKKEKEASEEEKQNKEAAKISKQMSSNIERATLGSLDALINLKADMQLAEAKKKAKKAEAKIKEDKKEEDNTDKATPETVTEEKKVKSTAKAKTTKAEKTEEVEKVEEVEKPKEEKKEEKEVKPTAKAKTTKAKKTEEVEKVEEVEKPEKEKKEEEEKKKEVKSTAKTKTTKAKKAEEAEKAEEVEKPKEEKKEEKEVKSTTKAKTTKAKKTEEAEKAEEVEKPKEEKKEEKTKSAAKTKKTKSADDVEATE
ncbi:MAG: 30S ribosomal protein S1 [Bacteroidales bacterium]|jgi:small subunit ribosomal protein S1|nr:30S ribosomal protein S1 [Bacteroidales bacterium]